MKVDVLSLEGKKVKSINLPSQFDEEYRPDLIKKAVEVVQSNKRQSHGASERAGKDYSAKLSRRRRNYRGAYGYGISRVPRKIMTRRGRHFYWIGALAPGTVGGRRAHPPKAEKDYSKNINIKERRKAIRSALAATLDKKLVEKRGHIFKEVPLIIESKFESLDKSKDVKKVLEIIGLKDELNRVSKRKVRAGKGKTRGRKYKVKVGPLLVVSNECKLEKSAINIPGLNIIKVNLLNAELLAPGASAGRLTVFTDKAIEKMSKENLFFNIKNVKEKKVKEDKK